MKRNFTAAFVDTVKVANGRVDYWDTKLSGFGLRVSQSGVKTWCVFYRHAGVPRRFTIGTYPALGLNDARQEAQRSLRDADLGKDPSAAKQAARAAETFGELATLYLENWAKVEKRSWAEDERIVERELLPAWKNRKASHITGADVVALTDGIKKRPAGVMANRALALISKIYNFGIGRQVVTANPAFKIPRPGKEMQRTRTLSDDEIKTLWNALESETPKAAAFFKLALLTAQRSGEILGMTTAELDLNAGWWTIPAERAKNGHLHRVPLAPQALAIIKALVSDSPFIFPGPRKKPISNYKKWVTRLREATGMEDEKEFRSHDLRRTAATSMTGLKIPRLTVSKILNHAEQGVTAIYDRTEYDDEKRDALTRWDARLAQIVA
jgi:integrase